MARQYNNSIRLKIVVLIGREARSDIDGIRSAIDFKSEMAKWGWKRETCNEKNDRIERGAQS
jgi:hypothetical protein